MLPGQFVISLDFELLWGVRDHADRESYGTNILGGRKAIPAMLDIFAENEVRATWATVGFVMCESKDELLASIPDILPNYRNKRLSAYEYISEVGADEKSDPYYFAPSLVKLISAAPGQEIGTHTLSHYYCLEEGQSIASFEADIASALALAERRNIKMQSIVFPRNQFSAEHIDACARVGLVAYRGNPPGWAYTATAASDQTSFRQALRLLDAYTGVLSRSSRRQTREEPGNVPASRFLRPCAGKLARFHPLHVRTICRGMTAAARAGKAFHLWWHPHNFGIATDDNMNGLRQIILHFASLKDEYGMQSAAMRDLA